MILTVDGNELTFVKANRSHWDGDECVHVSTQGTNAFLVESDAPGLVLKTSTRNLATFFDGVKNGEFDHLVADVPQPVTAG